MKITKERKFKTAQDLIDFIKHQLNKEIKINRNLKGKPNLGIIYMEIDFDCQLKSIFGKYKIRADHHIGNKYFVYLV